MSNPRRPVGVPPDDHGLEREPRADAPNDADALDAWLNEIAQGSGFPGTRSGIGQHRPDARIDDHDATDADSLIETAARFHRRVEAAHAATPRAVAPDPQLWETIMERTSTPAAAATGTIPQSAPQRMKQTPAPLTTTTTRHRAMRRQHTWNMVANIGLVAAILLALFGTWRLAGTPGMPGGDDGSQPVSHMAMQPATPGGTPAVTAPAVGTPTPATGCDLSEDIPIFNGVDKSAWDGTAVLLTTSGRVLLTCPEEPDGTVLMETSPHGSVGPLDWPGAVVIPSYGEKPEEARTRVLSLTNGTVVEFGYPTDDAQRGTEGARNSPWLVGPAPEDTADEQILDLRTMQTRLLSEIAGTSLPEHGGYLVSGDGTEGTLVLGLQSHHSTDGNGTLITDSGMPGDLLVVNGSLQTASWISVPDDFPPVADIAVSPDGTHVALHGVNDQFSQEREDAFSLLRLSDGKEIERSSTISDGPEPNEGIWVQRGKALAYINGNELVLLPLLSDMSEQAVFEAEGPLTGIRATVDQDTVIVERQWGDDLATMVANEQSPIFYTVELLSRDVTTFTGVDVSNNTSPWPYPNRFLVTFEPQEQQGDTVTYQVIDAVTGETVGTLEDVPLNDRGYPGYPNLGPLSVASSPDGNTELIAFDSQHTWLIRAVDGQYQIEHLAPPAGTLSQTPLPLSLQFSPDGSLVWMSGQSGESDNGYLLHINAVDLTWEPVPSTGDEGSYIPFVPGTGTTGVQSDWMQEIKAGYDFSEVPDGTEFMDSEELAAELRATENSFSWPAGYDPDVEAMIGRNGAPDGSRFQEGMAYTSLGISNQCAWNQTWLDAFESGDEETARKALWVMTEIFPTFPNQDWSVVEWQLKAASLAADGDPAMVQQSVTVNCQGMLWE